MSLSPSVVLCLVSALTHTGPSQNPRARAELCLSLGFDNLASTLRTSRPAYRRLTLSYKPPWYAICKQQVEDLERPRESPRTPYECPAGPGVWTARGEYTQWIHCLDALASARLTSLSSKSHWSAVVMNADRIPLDLQSRSTGPSCVAAPTTPVLLVTIEREPRPIRCARYELSSPASRSRSLHSMRPCPQHAAFIEGHAAPTENDSHSRPSSDSNALVVPLWTPHCTLLTLRSTRAACCYVAFKRESCHRDGPARLCLRRGLVRGRL